MPKPRASKAVSLPTSTMHIASWKSSKQGTADSGTHTAGKGRPRLCRDLFLLWTINRFGPHVNL